MAVSGTKGIAASAHLAITPAKNGMPLSGQLMADYNGSTDNVTVKNSYLALPHSRLTLDGSLSKQLNIALTTRSLKDFPTDIPVSLQGDAKFTGAVTGGLNDPRVTGHLAANQFSVEGQQFTSLSADVAAAAGQASVANGSLTRRVPKAVPMQAGFAGGIGLKNWSALPSSPLTADLAITGGDLADVMALAEQSPAGYSGALTASGHLNGTLGNPSGAASIQVANGTLVGESFDELQSQVNLSDQLVTIPTAYIRSGSGRVDLSADYRHPRDSFTTGSVHAHIKSNPIDLSRRPGDAGNAQLDADVNARVETNAVQLTSINGNASAHSLRLAGQSLGDFSATAKTSGNAASYDITSDFAGSAIRVNGVTQLAPDYPTTADINIGNLPVDKVLSAAKRTDIPARGILAGTAHVTGTWKDPEGDANLSLTKAVIYDEPLDSVRARVSYLAKSVDVSQLEIVAGPSRINLTAHYDHPAGNLQQGSARFRVADSQLDLARIHNVQTLRPGLGGEVDLSLSGSAAVGPGNPQFRLSNVNANVAASGIAAGGHNYGNLKFTATSGSGSQVNFALDSALADAAIHGQGSADLVGDYPVNARLTFANVQWTHLQPLLGIGTGPSTFEAATEGEVTVSGPFLKADQLNGSLRLSKLNFTAIAQGGVSKAVTVANQGAVEATLDHGIASIRNAHLTGPQTDLQVTGSTSLKDQSLNLNVSANADIGLLQSFDREIYSSGKVIVAATVKGTTSQPAINGQVTLQNAAFNYAELPVGISNAAGVIQFNGNTARIQNLSAESGGGRLSVSGFAGFSQGIRFGLEVGASNVRVRVQEGVSINASANVRLSGTPGGSVLSGTATINQVNYAPRSDIGSILVRSAPPVQSASSPSQLLDNMKLDIRVRTSPSLAVHASLAENLQADADLRVRGTAAQPGILGRVVISEGKLVFFGSEYTVDSGTIAFYNPVRIDPILDMSLETQAKGVTVTLRVTGPVDNMKLSYTSDPPLQFQEIVSLLAAGSTPTSDPTLLANQPLQPAQGFQQMGESAIVSRALVDPVAGRLQRVFGLTQLKIDPTFTTGSDVPTASLTLQQRITNNLTFTYVSAVNDPNSTTVRIEWAFNPQYSAVATRDENGIFSINFFYKRQFR